MYLTLCMLGTFFLVIFKIHLFFFFKTIRMSNSLGPNQDRRFVGRCPNFAPAWRVDYLRSVPVSGRSATVINDQTRKLRGFVSYTTLANFITKYHVMCKDYIK